MGLKHIRGSNGNGEAVLATVTAARNPGSTIITVDSVTNWPQDFIATAGKKLADNTLDPTTVIVFTGHLSGLTIVIDSIAPGYSDTRGSAVADVVVLKPTTQWANNINDTLAVSINDNGTLNTAQVTSAVSDWKPLSVAPTLSASNGQREYVLSFPGVDYTDRLSAGMKLKGSRTVAAQTQSTSLNGTNQYWSKTSPAGMTFTDDFVAGAWVKLSSYSGANAEIISRYNGTSGWELRLNGSGQVDLVGRNGGATNIRMVTSYQSIPLNKWVHITAQLDMSAHTATTTTSYVMIDGVDVPAFVSQSGTNPTALIQAGNLEIGSDRGGIELFPGSVQNAFVTSAKLTQAQVRAFKDKKLTTALATSNTMAAAFPFDGNGNDVSTNANNLTANGSATATDTGTAFDTNLWGIITKTPTYSGGNTSVTVFTPQGAGIPNETLGTFSYSTARAPYGFPAERGRWAVEMVLLSSINVGVGTTGVLYNPGGLFLSVPSGSWLTCSELGSQGNFTGGTADFYTGVSSSLSVFSDPDLVAREYSTPYSGAVTKICKYTLTKQMNMATQTKMYVLISPGLAASGLYLRGAVGTNVSEYSKITAECAYL